MKRRFRAIQASSVAGLALFVALGLGYWMYASRQQAYFTNRDTRALVTMSRQVGGALSTIDRILPKLGSDPEQFRENSIARHLLLASRDGKQTTGGGEECLQVATLAGGRTPTSSWALRNADVATCLQRAFAAAPARRLAGQRAPTATASSKFDLALLNPRTLFDALVREPVERGIVDAAMVVDTSGLVLAYAGPADLHVRRIDKLLGTAVADAKARDEKVPDVAWQNLRESATRRRFVLSGETYDLHLQPCCLSGDVFADRGLVTVALVRHRALVRRSLQISYTIVAGFLAVLLLATSALPFIRLQLITRFQRVSGLDVLALAFCVLLSLALTTVVTFDAWAYMKLTRELNAQVVALGDSVASHLGRELTVLHRDLLGLAAAADRGELRVDSDGRGRDMLADPLPRLRYPRFDSWALVDLHGEQTRKWSFDSYTQPTVNLADRDYFQTTRRGEGWSVRRLRDAGVQAADSASAPLGADTLFTLESVQSWTTGRPQAALMIPRPQKDSCLAMLAVELASVIEPVVAPGALFAVIDAEGRVLFHSDVRRNLYESFFEETDHDRAVRSAVFARTRAFISIRYGGEDHTAYLRPFAGTPWTIVAMRERRPARITNLETIATTLGLVLGFALVALALGLANAYARGERRLSWMWPDRSRATEYSRLSAAFLCLLIAFVLAIWFLVGWRLASMMALLAILGGLLAWSALRVRGGGGISFRRLWPVLLALVVWLVAMLWNISIEDTWRAGLVILLLATLASAIANTGIADGALGVVFARWPVSRRYLLCTTLLLLVLGVVPAVGFFQVAHRLHTLALVRHTQYRVAMDLEARDRARRATYSATRGARKDSLFTPAACDSAAGLCDLGVYTRQFFDTRLIKVTDTMPKRVERWDRFVLPLVEPYESENSVERRPMMADRALDSTWSATTTVHITWLLHHAPSGRVWGLRSHLPSLSPKGYVDWLTALAAMALFVTIAWWLAYFVARRLFLVDLLDVRPLGEVPMRIRVRRRLIAYATESQVKDMWDELPPGKGSLDWEEVDLAKPEKDWPADLQSLKCEKPMLIRWPSAHGSAVASIAPRLDLLELLLRSARAGVVVLITLPTAATRAGDRRLHFAPRDDGDAAWTERVARLLSAFQLSDALRVSGRPDYPLPSGLLAAPVTLNKAILVAESSGDAELERLWNSVRDELSDPDPAAAATTTAEFLDRLSERAAPYYQAVWSTCSAAERVVLVHIAEHRYANSQDRETLRRLFERGLIRRTPRLAMLNETFRLFVLERAPDVERVVLGYGTKSVWDAIKWPIAVIVMVVLGFFAATQQEFISAANGVLVGLTALLPSAFKLVSWVAEKKPPG